MKTGFAVDASVVLKWYTKRDEKNVDLALQLREDYKKRKVNLYSPSLLAYEVINVLRFKPNLDSAYIQDTVESLYEMGILEEMDKEDMKTTVDLALQYSLTVYDASYLSFARVRNIPLITADQKFYEQVKEGLILLKDYLDLSNGGEVG